MSVPLYSVPATQHRLQGLCSFENIPARCQGRWSFTARPHLGNCKIWKRTVAGDNTYTLQKDFYLLFCCQTCKSQTVKPCSSACWLCWPRGGDPWEVPPKSYLLLMLYHCGPLFPRQLLQLLQCSFAVWLLPFSWQELLSPPLPLWLGLVDTGKRGWQCVDLRARS